MRAQAKSLSLQTTWLNLVMQPGILVRGGVRTEDSSILPRGLRVNLIDSDLAQFDRNAGTVTENGAFEIAGVALGNYRVVVSGLPSGYEVLHSRAEIMGGELDVVVAKVPGDAANQNGARRCRR